MIAANEGKIVKPLRPKTAVALFAVLVFFVVLIAHGTAIAFWFMVH